METARIWRHTYAVSRRGPAAVGETSARNAVGHGQTRIRPDTDEVPCSNVSAGQGPT